MDAKFINEFFEGRSSVTEREKALALEVGRRLLEYYDELIDMLPAPAPAHNTEIIVRCRGITFKFENVDSFSNWLSGWRNWNG